MHLPTLPVSLTVPLRRAAAGAALVLAAAAASAATIAFDGVTDSGTLAGLPFSGRFAFADVGAGFSGSVALTAFELAFAGTVYGLADADTAPAAAFDGGSLLGVDYVSTLSSPAVQLTAGFFDIGEAFFAYRDPVAGGFGSLAFRPLDAVMLPEPGALGLVATGLLGGWLVPGLAGRALRRRRPSR